MLNGVGQVEVVPKGRRGMCDALNEAFEVHEFNLGYAVGFIGDDMLPRTKGFDTNMLEALRGGSLFCYANDLFQGERMATEWVERTTVAQALGYMVPPGFAHLNVDVVVREWGKACNAITYLDDTIIEHMHPLAGKGKMDTGYSAVNSGELAARDNAEYSRYKESGEFRADVAKLKVVLKGAKTSGKISR
jgi:hypothetical protein